MASDPGIPAWLADVARRHAGDHRDSCLGTVRLIDAAARARGVDAVTRGECTSLARPVAKADTFATGDARETISLEVNVQRNGSLLIGTDRLQLDAHGIPNTHLDGLTHLGVDGSWHGGVPAVSPVDNDSLAAWARHGLATRAVLVDVTALRGTAWVENGRPVGGDEIDACLRATGVVFEPGDALLLYMGRDRFEAAGNVYPPISDADDGRPGVGPSGAEWVADNGVSLLGWDFLDAHGHGVDPLAVHLLIWAIGLALVDNCELATAAASLRDKAQPTGLLAVAPLPITGTTGCMVNPLLLH